MNEPNNRGQKNVPTRRSHFFDHGCLAHSFFSVLVGHAVLACGHGLSVLGRGLVLTLHCMLCLWGLRIWGGAWVVDQCTPCQIKRHMHMLMVSTTVQSSSSNPTVHSNQPTVSEWAQALLSELTQQLLLEVEFLDMSSNP